MVIIIVTNKQQSISSCFIATFQFVRIESSDGLTLLQMDEKTTLIKPSAPSESVNAAQQVRVGDWEAPLWGCFTHIVPNCFMVTFLPCVSIAQISSRLGILSYGATLVTFLGVFAVQFAMSGLMWHESQTYKNSTDVDDAFDNTWWYRSSDGYGTAYHIYNMVLIAAQVVVFLYVRNLRGKVRERFEIPGNDWKDISVSICCTWCTIAQLATHVKSYSPRSCTFGPPDTLPAFPDDTAAPRSFV